MIMQVRITIQVSPMHVGQQQKRSTGMHAMAARAAQQKLSTTWLECGVDKPARDDAEHVKQYNLP